MTSLSEFDARRWSLSHVARVGLLARDLDHDHRWISDQGYQLKLSHDFLSDLHIDFPHERVGVRDPVCVCVRVCHSLFLEGLL